MLKYDFNNSVGYWTTMASNAFQRAVNDEVRPHGITWRQCQVLGYLALEGALSQTDLAECVGVEPPTLVRMLDRMERDGWIRRDNCPNDRRKKLISATAAAEPVWDKIAECARRVRKRAIEGLSAAEAKQLKEMLAVVQRNLTAEALSEAS
jgi:MarR family transcriptional regulator for hemolysin